MRLKPSYVDVVLLTLTAAGCAPKFATVPELPEDRFTFTAVLHSPGTLAGVPADQWYAEPLPEDKQRGRKPMAIDVSDVVDRAKELDGQRVKMTTKIPKTQQEAEAAQRATPIRLIEPG